MFLSEFLAKFLQPRLVFGDVWSLSRQDVRVEVDTGGFRLGDVSLTFGYVGQGVLETAEVAPFAVALEVEVAALRDFVCCSSGH